MTPLSPTRRPPGQLTLLRDLQLVDLGPRLDGLLAARHGLADGLQSHALLCQLAELCDLGGSPRLAMSFEAFGHDCGCERTGTARQVQ